MLAATKYDLIFFNGTHNRPMDCILRFHLDSCLNENLCLHDPQIGSEKIHYICKFHFYFVNSSEVYYEFFQVLGGAKISQWTISPLGGFSYVSP